MRDHPSCVAASAWQKAWPRKIETTVIYNPMQFSGLPHVCVSLIHQVAQLCCWPVHSAYYYIICSRQSRPLFWVTSPLERLHRDCPLLEAGDANTLYSIPLSTDHPSVKTIFTLAPGMVITEEEPLAGGPVSPLAHVWLSIDMWVYVLSASGTSDTWHEVPPHLQHGPFDCRIGATSIQHMTLWHKRYVPVADLLHCDLK